MSDAVFAFQTPDNLPSVPPAIVLLPSFQERVLHFKATGVQCGIQASFRTPPVPSPLRSLGWGKTWDQSHASPILTLWGLPVGIPTTRPPASSRSPQKLVQVLAPLGKEAWGEGRREGVRASGNTVPLRGSRTPFRPPPHRASGLAPGLPLSWPPYFWPPLLLPASPSSAGLDGARCRARGVRRIARYSPSVARDRDPSDPARAAISGYGPQPRGEEARRTTGDPPA